MTNPVAALLALIRHLLDFLAPTSGRHRVGTVIEPYRPRRTITLEPITMVIPDYLPVRALRIPPYITASLDDTRELTAVR